MATCTPFDEFSTLMIPHDFAHLIREESTAAPETFKAHRSKGNGNCLFNSVSLCLIGNESMSASLRKKCGHELVNNLDAYYVHPHLEEICRTTGISKSILMHTLLGNDALSKGSIRQSYEYEARQTFNMNHWCSMLHVFALSNVLRRNIVSVFPYVPTVYRSLVHGIITPLSGVYQSSDKAKPIVILWTRDGNFDSTPGAVYVPNHVVPLISHSIQYPQKRHSTSLKCIGNTKQAKMHKFFTSLTQSRSATPDSVPLLGSVAPSDIITPDFEPVPAPVSVAPPDSQSVAVTGSPSTPASGSATPDSVSLPSSVAPSDGNTHEFEPVPAPVSVAHPDSQSVAVTGSPPISASGSATPDSVSLPSSVAPSDVVTPDFESGTAPAPMSGSEDALKLSKPATIMPTASTVPSGSSRIKKPVTALASTSYSRAPRTFQSRWLLQFSWLLQDGNVLKCKICIAAKKENLMTKGKAANNAKKDDFAKHEKCIDHRSAQQVPIMRKHMQAATVNAYNSVRAGIIAQMATILVQAQEAIPSVKNSKLIRLQIFNGASSLKHLQSEESYYQTNDSINDMYSVMADMLKDDVIADRKSSPYPFYGIEIDEATDVASKSIIVGYQRYVDKFGMLKIKYLGVEELMMTDADSIFTATRSIMDSQELHLNEMTGLATDGASVMTGVHKGVATQFKRLIQQLVTTHCMAHRLQLVSEKAASSVPYVAKYIGVVNQFAKSLKFSPKFQRILERSKEVHQEKANKIKQIFFTRWLSFTDSVQALAGSIGAVISALQDAAVERGTEGRAILHGVLAQMSTVKFILMTHFLADLVGILGLLSRSLQKEGLTYLATKSQIEAAILAIQSLLTHPGPYTKEIIHLQPTSTDVSGYVKYKGHDIKDSEQHRQKFKEASEALVEQVVTRLEMAFPDHAVMDSFMPLCPKECKLLNSEETQMKMEVLTTHYNMFVNTQSAMMEWNLLKNVIKQDIYCQLDLQGCMEYILHPNQETYPNLSKLAAIGLSLPVTSVSCERGISGYNAIKSESRNMLSVAHMDKLMRLYVESPDLDHFNFDRAFEMWVAKKDRRGMNNMVANAKN